MLIFVQNYSIQKLSKLKLNFFITGVRSVLDTNNNNRINNSFIIYIDICKIYVPTIIIYVGCARFCKLYNLWDGPQT